MTTRTFPEPKPEDWSRTIARLIHQHKEELERVRAEAIPQDMLRGIAMVAQTQASSKLLMVEALTALRELKPLTKLVEVSVSDLREGDTTFEAFVSDLIDRIEHHLESSAEFTVTGMPVAPPPEEREATE